MLVRLTLVLHEPLTFSIASCIGYCSLFVDPKLPHESCMYLYDEGESVLLLFRIGVKLLHFLSKGHLLEFSHHSKELKSRSSNDIHSHVETMTQAKELV